MDDGKSKLVLTGVPEVDDDNIYLMSGALPNDGNESPKTSEPQQVATASSPLGTVDSLVYHPSPSPLSPSDSDESVHVDAVTSEGSRVNDGSQGTSAKPVGESANTAHFSAGRFSNFIPETLWTLRRG